MIKRKIINDLLNLKRKHVREALLIKGRVNQVKLRLCEKYCFVALCDGE